MFQPHTHAAAAVVFSFDEYEHGRLSLIAAWRLQRSEDVVWFRLTEQFPFDVYEHVRLTLIAAWRLHVLCFNRTHAAAAAVFPFDEYEHRRLSLIAAWRLQRLEDVVWFRLTEQF